VKDQKERRRRRLQRKKQESRPLREAKRSNPYKREKVRLWDD
jgi:hypothetical protein